MKTYNDIKKELEQSIKDCQYATNRKKEAKSTLEFEVYKLEEAQLKQKIKTLEWILEPE